MTTDQLDNEAVEIDALRQLNICTGLLGLDEPAAAVLAMADRIEAMRRDHPHSALIGAVADQAQFAVEIADADPWRPAFLEYRTRMASVHSAADELRHRLMRA
jgi:hypothetical protein